MQQTRNLFKFLFWLATGSLIAFCVLFGTPFLSKIAASKVVAMAGCRPASFDMQAVCPAGSYAEPFVPLSHWFTSMMAPFVLVQNFGGVLAAWACLCIGLAFARQFLRTKSTF